MRRIVHVNCTTDWDRRCKTSVVAAAIRWEADLLITHKNDRWARAEFGQGIEGHIASVSQAAMIRDDCPSPFLTSAFAVVSAYQTIHLAGEHSLVSAARALAKMVPHDHWSLSSGLVVYRTDRHADVLLDWFSMARTSYSPWDILGVLLSQYHDAVLLPAWFSDEYPVAGLLRSYVALTSEPEKHFWRTS